MNKYIFLILGKYYSLQIYVPYIKLPYGHLYKSRSPGYTSKTVTDDLTYENLISGCNK